MISTVLAIAGVALGVSGQFADGYSTYEGVVVKKTQAEADSGALNNWLIAHPWALLIAKPAAVVLGGAFLIVFGLKDSIPAFAYLALGVGLLAGGAGWASAIPNFISNAK